MIGMILRSPASLNSFDVIVFQEHVILEMFRLKARGSLEPRKLFGPRLFYSSIRLLAPKPQGVLVMEVLISAVASDLVSRFISFLAQNYGYHTGEEDDCRRLEHVLLRMHTVVEEAEGRHITNRGMLLQLKTLVEGMYLGYYMLDRLKLQSLEEESVEDEVSHQGQSFEVCTFRTAKRLRFAAAITKNMAVAFGIGSTTKLKGVLESLEAKIADV